MTKVRRRIAIGGLFAFAAIAVFVATIAPNAAASYFSGIICSPNTRGPGFSSQNDIFENTSHTDMLGVSCPVPLDHALGTITFNFSVGVRDTGSSRCRGWAYDRDATLIWVSNETVHTGSSGFSDLSPGNGPAGTLNYNYNATCQLAPDHLMRRIQLD